MKKVVIGLVLGLFIGVSGTAIAAQSNTVQAVFAKYLLKIGNREPIEINPLVYDGTTYLPVRKAAELLGYDVGWDEKTRTIELTQPNETKTVKAGGSSTNLSDEDWVSYRDLWPKYQIGAVIGALHDEKFNVIGQGMVLTSGDVKVTVFFNEERQKAKAGDVVSLPSTEGPFRIKVIADNGNDFVLSVEDLKKYKLIK